MRSQEAPMAGKPEFWALLVPLQSCSKLMLQKYFAHKKEPTPLGPP